MLPQSVGGGDDPDFVYTPGNSTFDFRGYCVMTNQAMYWGFYVTDATYGNSQLWRGDGVDPFFGLYDINAKEDILGSMDYGKGWLRFGVAARAATADKLQWNGYDTAFDLPVTIAAAPAGFETNDYIVEWSFRFDSLANYSYNGVKGVRFIPTDGMFIPFKIDVNDNDTTFDALKGSESRKHQLSFGATFEAAGWPNPFGWAGRAVITTVPKTGVAEIVNRPSRYELAQAYPNPFNPTTNISYKIARGGHVSLVIYDVLGREIKTLVNKEMAPGEYHLTWDGTDNFGKSVGSGIYFYQLRTGDFTKVQKVTLMK